MTPRSRVLLVDDDDALRGTLRRVLERAGYEVLVAVDGSEALSRLEHETVDVVITDLIMPNTEGLKVLMHLRQRIPSLPVIAISGGGRVRPDSYLATAALLGAARTLSKPFEGEQLLTAVREVLQEPG